MMKGSVGNLRLSWQQKHRNARNGQLATHTHLQH